MSPFVLPHHATEAKEHKTPASQAYFTSSSCIKLPTDSLALGAEALTRFAERIRYWPRYTAFKVRVLARAVFQPRPERGKIFLLRL
jgi:hypothetical protein